MISSDAAFSEAEGKRMRTKRLRRYEAPLLVKREVLPVVAAHEIGTPHPHY
jgi:hypothetical protein